MNPSTIEGIILIDKPLKITSFGVIAALRRITGVKKIGHCGTLDPLATGLLICLVGKNFTRLSDKLTSSHKTYLTTLKLGESTTTYDLEGEIVERSRFIPSLEEVKEAISLFQGTTLQMPPIFSAKKVGGQKACDLARAGKEVTLTPNQVEMEIELISYNYPELTLKVYASKGTYIRSLAHDLGIALKTFAHLNFLRRIQSGSFIIDQAISLEKLKNQPELLNTYLKSSYV